MKDKKQVKSLTLKELLEYEKALAMLMQHYDNSARLYDNTINYENYDKNETLKKLVLYGTMHTVVLGYIEEKINELDL